MVLATGLLPAQLSDRQTWRLLMVAFRLIGGPYGLRSPLHMVLVTQSFETGHVIWTWILIANYLVSGRPSPSVAQRTQRFERWCGSWWRCTSASEPFRMVLLIFVVRVMLSLSLILGRQKNNKSTNFIEQTRSWEINTPWASQRITRILTW